jgi:cytoskeletal protein CcmA (bactofilin family)
MQSPQNIHIKGNAKVTGRVSGAGILFVEGDLDISGELNWQGIVLVGTCYHCYGFLKGSGKLSVSGALVLNKDIDTVDLFSGTTDIRYSCATIRNAQRE